MASSSSGASSSSTTTPSPSGNKNKGSTDKLPSTALMNNKENDLTSSNEVDTEDDLNNISSSLSSAWVDDIRFSSYRLAAKLRLLQQKTGLALLDVWNVIEAFRENGLNHVEPDLSIPRAKLEALLASMYGALAKRLPPPTGSSSGSSSAVTTPKDLQAMASWLFSWLFTALKPAGASNIKVRTLKTAMTTLCSGKLLDKLRYLFSNLADTNGHMISERFEAFLRDVGRISSAVGEEKQRDESSEKVFEAYKNKPVTVNDFIETLMSDPGPTCLAWLPLLHRIVNAESVVHYGLRCSSCRSENFRGLKYKSDRGSNYQLCQACFWCGHISSEHKNDVFKEYNTYKPTTGGGGGSLRSTTPSSLKKSMNCLQADVGNNTTTSSGRNSSMSNKKSSKKVSKFSNEPHTEKPMDITKSAQGNSWNNQAPNFPIPPVRSGSSASNPISDLHFYGEYDDPYMAYPEDEHQLIAAYANQLANTPETNNTNFGGKFEMGEFSVSSLAGNMDAMSSHSKHLVRELERKNREIMRDIHQLKHAHRNRSQRLMQMPTGGMGPADPSIVSELEDLRNHKADLEVRLDELQTARRDLMLELEELMKLLKVNNQMVDPTPVVVVQQQLPPPGGPQQHFYSPQRPPSQTGGRMGGGVGGPRVTVSPATVGLGNCSRFDDITDVSGMGIDRVASTRMIANEDSVNSD